MAKLQPKRGVSVSAHQLPSRPGEGDALGSVAYTYAENTAQHKKRNVEILANVYQCREEPRSA